MPVIETKKPFLINERVGVIWDKHDELLEGVIIGFSHPEKGEDFERVRVLMDNGYACNGSGFHPECLVKLSCHGLS